MDPKITNISEENNVYKFTLSGINVSLANALRRIILSEIPVVAIKTDEYVSNKCYIEINTTRLHNEILKQRLSCIPICISPDELNILPDKYLLEIDMKNETDDMLFITTKHFKIKNKLNGNYLTDAETRRIFPPNELTKDYILFARLRPKIGDSIPGEHLKLTADFCISNASEDAKFNVVCNCSYGFTPDMAKINETWKDKERMLKSQDISQTEIEFQKKNFYILDSQRHYIENSYDFIIETVGCYENRTIVKQGISVLNDKFGLFIKDIDAGAVIIKLSETIMDNCYDIILDNEDYTLGKSIEYFIYDKYYVKDKSVKYCGFVKEHPHDSKSIIRIAFESKAADKNMVKQCLRACVVDAQTLFSKMYKLF